jgi:hypothetical protein
MILQLFLDTTLNVDTQKMMPLVGIASLADQLLLTK